MASVWLRLAWLWRAPLRSRVARGGASQTVDDETQNVPEAQVEPVSEVALSHYIAIQESLAADSMDGVRDHAAQLAENLAASGAVEAARTMAQTEDIAEVRRQFETVSIALLADLKANGSASGEFHEAFCPMAFNNRGASWIQADTTVNNPYYGATMLRCGVIQETFASATDSSL